MRTRTFGRTGLTVGEIGLGAWQFGDDEGWDGPDEQESRRIVDEAANLGCTFIDTAPAYAGGRSEDFIGRAIEGRRDDFVLCTKFGNGADASLDADAIQRSVESSLQRLRTDHVDILLLHSPPRELLTHTPLFATLERLKESGAIRHYGVSLRGDGGDELRAVLAETGSEAVEVRFNALYQEPADAIAEAGEAGVGVIVKVPLESGWLSGKYDATSRFEGARSRWSADDIARRAGHLEAFESVLSAGLSTSHAALQFVLGQPGVSTVIPGTKSVGQLRDNVAAGSAELPASTLRAVRQMWTEQIAPDPTPW